MKNKLSSFEIPIEISARHIHLSQKDFDILFGNDYQLSVKNQLSQIGQFAANETVQIVGKNGNKLTVRVVGPVRNETQLEISITDNYFLAVDDVCLRVSGDLEKSCGGVKIIGPKGEVNLEKGVIVALRHLHISNQEAIDYDLADGQKISIGVPGIRSIIFNDVVVRVDKNFKLSFQVDTDEANAAGISGISKGIIVR